MTLSTRHPRRARSPALAGLSLVAVLAAMQLSIRAALSQPANAIAMHGEPALAADFDHLPYANPKAPKGGTMHYGVFGTFDNLNPIIVRGAATTARGIWGDPEFGNFVFEPLMQRSADEPFTLYALLAQSVETDEARTFVEFQLNPAAKFSDGKPVRVEDVLFTTEMMKRLGVVRPQYTSWLSLVERIEKVGDRGIRFTFKEKADRELPLLLAGLPVLPEHAFNRDTFERTTLTPVIGSGPYVIETVVPGQRIVYRRNPDYWGKDLPIKRGIDNYDRVSIEYYRDPNAQFTAFQKGLTYVFLDGDPQHWRTSYDFPAVKDGRVRKEVFQTGRPAGLNAFFFNTRRPIFANREVRAAVAMLFDFEWTNANLYYGAYNRTTSFFANSELASTGRPADDRERQLLAPFPDAVTPEVMAGEWRPPVSDGSGHDRNVMLKAVELLKSVGCRFEGSRMLGPDGNPLTFEILVQVAEQERLAIVFARTLERVGIAVRVRQVDDAQYQARRQTFDYDMLMAAFGASLSPGAEQINRWGSASRDANGSLNYAGVASPVVDTLLRAMVTATTREDFVSAVRAYDRVLISGQYVVPLFYIGQQWMAAWNFMKHPERTALTGYTLPAFWMDPPRD